jgi:hypothetical protein
MAQNILFNGVAYEVPDTGDTDWGEDLTDYFVAIPQGCLQKVGGSFTLTADANFGSNFGPVVIYVKSVGNNISTAGFIRMERTAGIGWRNEANDGNVLLTVNSSNELLWNGVKLTVSGLITNADIAADAAIARSKLASGTAYRLVANDTNGVMSENAALTPSEVVIVDANGQLTGEAALAISRGGTGETSASDAINALLPDQTSQSGKFLSTNGTAASWEDAPSAPDVPLTTVYTSGSGTHTLTGSPRWIEVEMVGAGGGGGGSSDDGSGGTGGTGGNTTFGTSLLTATGGGGGAGTGGADGGGGGSATINSPGVGVAIVGVTGGGTQSSNSTVYSYGGIGGSTAFGGAATSPPPGGAGKTASANTGSGGSGGSTATASGSVSGAGGGSGGYIKAQIDSPDASYSYAIGAGGTAGTAGSNGQAGGAGGSGLIIVREFY